jgi:glyoxylase-like metal-dependent hydrolase (beta-lactamase superfamily II)
MAGKPLLVRRFATGGDRNFGYLIADPAAKKGALVDPSPSPGGAVGAADHEGIDILYVFATHGHADHTSGLARAGTLTGGQVLAFGDREEVTGRTIAHGASFPLGGKELTVLHTPGHTEDSICLLAEDALFSGDTLFVGKVGGTGLGADARAQHDSLHRILLALPDDTRVFPGHDYGTAAESTIGEERRSNPFLLRPDLDAFIDLKNNWAEYKRKHGIT